VRLLLVGAFAYPHVQGSQVYFQEQAVALRAAGAEVVLLTYGPGRSVEHDSPARSATTGEAGDTRAEDRERRRAVEGFESHAPPRWSVPSSGRSGPRPGKPLADLALAFALRRVVAAAGRRSASSSTSSPRRDAPDRASSGASSTTPAPASSTASSPLAERSSRAHDEPRAPLRPPFDAILAHHAEAAWLAHRALPGPRPPIVYCVHTLLEQELPEYFKSSREKAFSGRPPRDEDPLAQPASRPGDRGSPRAPETPALRAIAALGRVIDRRVSAQADAWIALTQSSSRVMGASSPAPGRRLAPPIPDPELDPERPNRDALARAYDLEPGGYFLYAGNLDPYQDLPLLEQVASARRAFAAGDRSDHGSSRGPLPIVIATHDARAERFAEEAAARIGAGLLVRRVRSAADAVALIGAARASLVPRRTLGGFPIKLANSLAVGTPVVALHGEEWGLVDGRDALIGAVDDPVGSIARALARLEQDPDLAVRLGVGARATWRAQHDPARIAAETLALIDALRPGR
jgi:glycosyltransferase involved in cell wall biosynthesis